MTRQVTAKCAAAAGVMGTLAAAGWDTRSIHEWWRAPREELDDVCPWSAMRFLARGQDVLELARRDTGIAVVVGGGLDVAGPAR